MNTLGSVFAPDFSSLVQRLHKRSNQQKLSLRKINPLVNLDRKNLAFELLLGLLYLQKYRLRLYESSLVNDPAWDLMLDLTLARYEHRIVTFSSACIATGVPTSTARRCVHRMVSDGILVVTISHTDRRTKYIEISDSGFASMTEYLLAMERVIGDLADNHAFL